ncbi:MAG: OB-fold putative lipoprotein [Pyrinomonadaceae bacterium]|nr:OB-fold putative lipoprotein [Pyrinomonadaceae bacterium]
MKINLFFNVVLTSICCLFLSACGNPSNFTNSENTTETKYSMKENKIPTASPAQTETPKIEKADYKMTVEELVDEFMREGATSEDLKKKYANKRIAVTGRVTMFSFEPNDATPPFVFLSAPDGKRSVTCYVSDKDTEGRRKISKGKIVTMQGTHDEFTLAGVLPSLGECFVLEAEQTNSR